MSQAIIGAVDIGGTKVALGLVTSDGRVLARRETATQPLCVQGAVGLGRVALMLRELAESSGVTPVGIGIGCTGPVDPFTGVIGNVETIPGWKGSNLAEEFNKIFGATVAVENDADAVALAESKWGSGKGRSRFLYVTFGTGIGGGVVFDGVLYRGAAGAHPEFGHHAIEASGPQCYCGARGCWEMLAAAPAMAAWYGLQAGSAGTTAQRVCELAAAGDAVALRAVEREATYLGIGLANLVTMFAPDAVALGGGVMRSWPLFEPQVREVLRRSCTMVPLDQVRLGPALLGEGLPLLGAACCWLHRDFRGSNV